MADCRVVTFQWTPGLIPGRPVYAMTWTVNGQDISSGFARADELDAWRSDLENDGWTMIVGPEPEAGQ
jgi:hypothetical protein